MGATSNGLGKGRVVIVTGGARRTGQATVLRLASLGYAVVVNYLSDQRTAESTVEAVLDDHGTAVAEQGAQRPLTASPQRIQCRAVC